VGRLSAQKIINAPNINIPRPVQRSTLIPAALFLTCEDPKIPSRIRMTL
jgi:hypothetical protein